MLPATQAAGEATSGWANSVIDALDAMTNPARAFMYQASAATTLHSSTTTWTPIAFDTTFYDTESGFDGSTKWVCPTGWAGFYLVIANLVFDAASGGARRLTVARNGVQVYGRSAGIGVLGSGDYDTQVTHEVFLGEGDYVEAWGRQSSGSDLNTLITSQRTSSLSVCWRAVA